VPATDPKAYRASAAALSDVQRSDVQRSEVQRSDAQLFDAQPAGCPPGAASSVEGNYTPVGLS
jgi:hypothetical protein